MRNHLDSPISDPTDNDGLTIPNPDDPYMMPIYDGSPRNVVNVLNPGIYHGTYTIGSNGSEWDVDVHIRLFDSYVVIRGSSTRFDVSAT